MRCVASSVKRLLAEEEMTGQVQLVLWGSLALAVLGALLALRIRLISPSMFRLDMFFHQFAVHDLLGSLLCAVIVLASAFLCGRGRFQIPPCLPRALDCLDCHRHLLAAVLAGLLAVGTLTIYHNYPLCLDEFSQFFQAQIFARGRIATVYPLELLDRLLPYTSMFFIVSRTTGEVVSSYWPGLSLLMAPFMFLGAPWLLNPLLGAGTLLLIRHLAAKLYPDTDAPAWAMLFALASPTFLAFSISYYGMPAQLFFNLLFTVLVLRMTPRSLVAAGVAGSLALVQTVPVPHAVYAVAWTVWLMARPGGLCLVLWLVMGYLPLSLVLGLGWAVLRLELVTQGAAGAKTMYENLADWLSVVSFSTFAHLVYYRLLAFLKLSSWSVPGLVFLSFVGARRSWSDRRVRVVLACALVTFGAYLLFRPTQGHGWGYRYFHGAWGTLPLLACGAVAAPLAGAGWRSAHSREFAPLARLAMTLTLLSLVFLNGLRLYQVHAFIDRHLGQLPPLDSRQTQVCFIRPGDGYYSIDMIQNDPFLRENIIFLKSPGPKVETAFMEKHFPGAVPKGEAVDTRVWLIKRPSWQPHSRR